MVGRHAAPCRPHYRGLRSLATCPGRGGGGGGGQGGGRWWWWVGGEQGQPKVSTPRDEMMPTLVPPSPKQEGREVVVVVGGQPKDSTTREETMPTFMPPALAMGVRHSLPPHNTPPRIDQVCHREQILDACIQHLPPSPLTPVPTPCIDQVSCREQILHARIHHLARLDGGGKVTYRGHEAVRGRGRGEP